jgi:hypothetical protein
MRMSEDRPVKAVDLDVRKRERTESRPQLIAATALAVAVMTGALLALELLRPVHGVDRGARAAIETAIAAVALLTTRLLIEASGQRPQLRELLLALGVFVLALAGFSYWAGSVVAGAPQAAFGGIVRLACELIGAFAFAAAAFVPSSATVRPLRGPARIVAALGVGTVAVAIVLADALTANPSAPRATGAFATHVIGRSAGLLAAVALAVAGLAFAARWWRAETGSELLAGACLLLAVSCVEFVAVPNVAADWVSPGDGARLLAAAPTPRSALSVSVWRATSTTGWPRTWPASPRRRSASTVIWGRSTR